MKSYVRVKRKTIKRKNTKLALFGLVIMTIMWASIITAAEVLNPNIYVPDAEQVELPVEKVVPLSYYEPVEEIETIDIDTNQYEIEEDEEIMEEPKKDDEVYFDEYTELDISADYIFDAGTNTNLNSSTNIHTYSGLSIDDVLTILEDTPALYPYAKDFYDMEQRYQVNVLFAISVASLESYYGTSNIAETKNNLFGFMRKGGPMTFETKAKSIDYFGKLISTRYVNNNLSTPYTIAPVYEPKDPSGWSSKVSSLMNKMVRKLDY